MPWLGSPPRHLLDAPLHGGRLEPVGGHEDQCHGEPVRPCGEEDVSRAVVGPSVRAPHMYKKVGVIVGRRVKSHMYEKSRGNGVEEGSI